MKNVNSRFLRKIFEKSPKNISKKIAVYLGCQKIFLKRIFPKIKSKDFDTPTLQNYSGNFIFVFPKISSRFCADFDRLQNHF